MTRSVLALNPARANALITGLMAVHSDTQDALLAASREGRTLDTELAEHRLAVCDGLISDILAAFDVDGWPNIRQDMAADSEVRS